MSAISLMNATKLFKGVGMENDRDDSENGFTLIETILAVIIGFSVLALAGKGIKSSWDSYRVGRMIDQVTEIQTAMSKAADVNGSYVAIDTIDKLVSDYNLSPDAKKSPYGQAVKVTGSAYGYVIEFPSSPKNACQQAVKRYPADIYGATTCTGATSNIVLTFNSDA